ncbi:SIMPL domain-containing protein [Piscibacillus salipiscarius]|uniref:SIMPL domain-containing protein n=1 Tax=Piscibacillus salipiscarius TaxID=299480 RepID=A0ABW5Q798_9BACI|nr:SIMPL domain-containing protein [Piscibacillus salipiscarius]
MVEQERHDERILAVMGEGVVTTEPNVAQVVLGVVTEDENLSVAQRQNADFINQVIQALMNEGIPREEIQTVDYSIQPLYDYVEGVQQFRGYQVSHMLSVTIDEIGSVGQVIDSAVEAGANRVIDIQFSVSHPEVFYQLALTRALEDAVGKAETLAEAMNTDLDLVPVKVVELSSDSPITYQTFALAESGGGTPIEPGQMDIKARIEAKFHYM